MAAWYDRTLFSTPPSVVNMNTTENAAPPLIKNCTGSRPHAKCCGVRVHNCKYDYDNSNPCGFRRTDFRLMTTRINQPLTTARSWPQYSRSHKQALEWIKFVWWIQSTHGSMTPRSRVAFLVVSARNILLSSLLTTATTKWPLCKMVSLSKLLSLYQVVMCMTS